MDTNIWGPLAWNLLHDVAVMGDKLIPKIPAMNDTIVRFFTLWQNLLPCVYCRQSFRRFSHRLPPQYPFRVWIYNIHNMVNRKLNKPLSLSRHVWLRRCKIYRCFGNTPQLWDLCFILVLNYNVKQQEYYIQWFQILRKLYAYLVRYRNYDPSMTPLFQSMDNMFSTPPPPQLLRTIKPRHLMQWLVYYYVISSSHSDNPQLYGFDRFTGSTPPPPFSTASSHFQIEYDRLVHRYQHSLASADPEEMWRVCGPFLEGRDR